MSITLKKSNFAKSMLDGAIDSGATSLSVTATEGTKFPQTGPFMMVLWTPVIYQSPVDDPNREIVMATWSSGDTFTVVRAQEGTTAAAWDSGSFLAHIITAGTLTEIETAIANHNMAVYMDSSNVKLAGISTEPTRYAFQGTNSTWDELIYPKSANKKAFWMFDAIRYTGGQLIVTVRWRAAQITGNVKFNVYMGTLPNTGVAVDSVMQSSRAISAVTVNGTADYLNVSTLTFTPTTSEITTAGLTRFALERDVTDTLNDEIGVISVTVSEV